MRFNDNHNGRWRNKSVLPVLMASRKVPDVIDRPHETYYLIVYVEVDDNGGSPKSPE